MLNDQLTRDLRAFISGAAFQSQAATAERDRLLSELTKAAAVELPQVPEAEPVAEPSAKARRYSVRFTRLSINSDAYRMNILADSEEHAEARFNAWAKGEIELTDEEEESEHHCKDYGIVDGHGDPELEIGCETYLEDEEDEEAAA